MSTWYVVGEVHADGVLGVVGVRVRRNAAVRPLQDLALVGRVIVGYTHTERGVAVLLPELAELLHAERFPREERSGLLDHFHYLRGLSVRWCIGDQVRERLHRGEREREREGGKKGEREIERVGGKEGERVTSPNLPRQVQHMESSRTYLDTGQSYNVDDSRHNVRVGLSLSEHLPPERLAHWDQRHGHVCGPV